MSADTQQQGAAITPLPWFVNGPYHIQAVGQYDATPNIVAHVVARRDGNTQQRAANADYIVRACNAYPALVAALEQTLACLVAKFGDAGFTSAEIDADPLVVKARAALAQVRE